MDPSILTFNFQFTLDVEIGFKESLSVCKEVDKYRRQIETTILRRNSFHSYQPSLNPDGIHKTSHLLHK